MVQLICGFTNVNGAAKYMKQLGQEVLTARNVLPNSAAQGFCGKEFALCVALIIKATHVLNIAQIAVLKFSSSKLPRGARKEKASVRLARLIYALLVESLILLLAVINATARNAQKLSYLIMCAHKNALILLPTRNKSIPPETKKERTAKYALSAARRFLSQAQQTPALKNARKSCKSYIAKKLKLSEPEPVNEKKDADNS